MLEDSGMSKLVVASTADTPNGKDILKRSAEGDLRSSPKRPRPFVIIGEPPQFKGSIGISENGFAAAGPRPQQIPEKSPEGAGNHFQKTPQMQTGPNITNASGTSAGVPSYESSTKISPIVTTNIVSINKSHVDTTRTPLGTGRSLATEGNAIPVVHRPTFGRTRGDRTQRNY
ncbi:hypothetical protein ACMFMF_002754 [Clarireedia jacksonii]